ncbi:MAG: YesL family protein [Lachnospiraceae bacterium]|nr:YesL family protein [Lachnospiraceae bacterium]
MTGLNLNYETNRFIRGMNIFADCLLAGALWIFTSIPIVTMGASSTALYYTVNKCIRNERSYVWKEYFPAFKDAFKKSTLTWLIFLILGVFLFLDVNLMKQVLQQESPLGALYYFFLVLSAAALAWVFYVFPYMARFEGGIRETLQKSFVFMIVNMGWSALLVVIFIACVLICNHMQFLLILFPGGFTLLQNVILEKLFRKYMKPEDIQKEMEANRRWKQ